MNDSKVRGFAARRGAAALVVVAAVGCGAPTLAPLEGTVTLDGRPLIGASVVFQRTEGPTAQRICVARTDEAGRYAAHPSWSDSPGVPPGTYQLFIKSVELPPDATETTALPPDPVPVQFRDGSQTVTVPSAGLPTADYALRSQTGPAK